MVAEMSLLSKILGRTRQDRICNEVMRTELGQMKTILEKEDWPDLDM